MELCCDVQQNKSKKRRRVELEKIDNKAALEVCFSKRRKGLFNKAAELCVLCGARIAVVAFSPHGNPHVFGHPSADVIINQYQGQVTAPPSSVSAANTNTSVFADAQKQYNHALREVDSMKMMKTIGEDDSGYWWERPVEGLGVEELQHYIDCVEKLKVKVNNRLEIMKGEEEDCSYFDMLSPITEGEGLTITRDFDPTPFEFDSIADGIIAEEVVSNNGNFVMPFEPEMIGLMEASCEFNPTLSDPTVIESDDFDCITDVCT